MEFKLILIGSGCGIPHKNYHPPCFAIQSGDKVTLVDTGYDSLQNILKYIDIRLLKEIFITHTHPDHFWGIVPLLFYLKCLKKEDYCNEIKVYGHERVQIFLNFLKNFYSSWFLRSPEILFVNPNEKQNVTFKTISTNHTDDSLAYAIKIKDKKIAFTGDCEFSLELASFLKDAYIIVCDCSFKVSRNGHMGLNDIEKLLYLTDAKKLVLVHSYRERGFFKEASKLIKKYGKRIVIGKDGIIIE